MSKKVLLVVAMLLIPTLVSVAADSADAYSSSVETSGTVSYSWKSAFVYDIDNPATSLMTMTINYKEATVNGVQYYTVKGTSSAGLVMKCGGGGYFVPSLEITGASSWLTKVNFIFSYDPNDLSTDNPVPILEAPFNMVLSNGGYSGTATTAFPSDVYIKMTILMPEECRIPKSQVADPASMLTLGDVKITMIPVSSATVPANLQVSGPTVSFTNCTIPTKQYDGTVQDSSDLEQLVESVQTGSEGSISGTGNDKNTYQIHSDAPTIIGGTSYPTVLITEHPEGGDPNLVDQKEAFKFNLTIPKGYPFGIIFKTDSKIQGLDIAGLSVSGNDANPYICVYWNGSKYVAVYAKDPASFDTTLWNPLNKDTAITIDGKRHPGGGHGAELRLVVLPVAGAVSTNTVSSDLSGNSGGSITTENQYHSDESSPTLPSLAAGVLATAVAISAGAVVNRRK